MLDMVVIAVPPVLVEVMDWMVVEDPEGGFWLLLVTELPVGCWEADVPVIPEFIVMLEEVGVVMV